MTAQDVHAELAQLASALAADVRRSQWLGRPLPKADPAKAAPVPAAATRAPAAAPPPPAREAPAAAAPSPSPPQAPEPQVERGASETSAPSNTDPAVNPLAQALGGLDLAPPRPVQKTELAEEVDRLKGHARGCADLDALRGAVADCTACALSESRTQTVFSDGTGKAGVVFVGEAPGFHEDRQGVPFVGRAGQLLTDIIEKGMGLAREDVLICNVLKCRPPENRDPTSHEKALCTAWLDRQLELADAKVVIALGRHAAMHLLGSDSSMARLRGRVHERGRAKVIATYHPAFLLRSPHMKKDCWQDIQLAMRELGLEPPARRRG